MPFTTRGGPARPRLTLQEQGLILHLAREKGLSSNAISKELGRSRGCVVKFLSEAASTAVLARVEFDKEAYNLSKRIIQNANVDQALEVMDRMGVLEKKRAESESGRPSVVVCIGMPGSPALIAPTDILVQRALHPPAIAVTPEAS